MCAAGEVTASNVKWCRLVLESDMGRRQPAATRRMSRGTLLMSPLFRWCVEKGRSLARRAPRPGRSPLNCLRAGLQLLDRVSRRSTRLFTPPLVSTVAGRVSRLRSTAAVRLLRRLTRLPVSASPLALFGFRHMHVYLGRSWRNGVVSECRRPRASLALRLAYRLRTYLVLLVSAAVRLYAYLALIAQATGLLIWPGAALWSAVPSKLGLWYLRLPVLA